MITRSDNGRASAVFARVGDAGLRALGPARGMRDFTVSGYWGSVHFSAADQARFFRGFDLLVPQRSRAVRAPAALVDRRLAALGLLALLAARRLAHLLQGRLAPHRPRLGSSTRPPSSSAGRCASRWPC